MASSTISMSRSVAEKAMWSCPAASNTLDRMGIVFAPFHDALHVAEGLQKRRALDWSTACPSDPNFRSADAPVVLAPKAKGR